MLEAIDLSKKYNKHPVINKLNLKVNPGELFCLLGSRGSGKTTLINLFLGFIEPDSGKVLVNGNEVKQDPHAIKELITFIPANPIFFPALSGIDNLEFICSQYNISFSHQMLIESLDLAGISMKSMHIPVASYSLINQKKLAIALAIAKKSKVLLIDEPGFNLSDREGKEFCNLISSLKSLNLASLITSRDTLWCTDSLTHTGILDNGQIIDSANENDEKMRPIEKQQA